MPATRSLLLCLLMSTPNPAATATEDAKLATFFRDYLDGGFSLRPSMATRLGDHRHDAQLDDVSAAACQLWKQHLRTALTELPQRVNTMLLSRDGLIDYEILAHNLAYRLWLEEEFDPYTTDPRSYNNLLTGSVFSLLTRMGCEVIDMGVVRDDPALLEAAFVTAAAKADAIITSGGVSVGEADYTKAMMKKLGDVAFWRVAMRPGRPMAVGRISSAKLASSPGGECAKCY